MEKGASQPSLIKEYEKHISCKKVTFVSMYSIVYSMLPAEEGMKETYAYVLVCEFGSIPPPPSESIVYLLHRKMKE
jgi:hypothetical protein